MYFWKYYLYYKKDTKVGSQNFGYQIWFCTRLISDLDLFHIPEAIFNARTLSYLIQMW